MSRSKIHVYHKLFFLFSLLQNVSSQDNNNMSLNFIGRHSLENIINTALQTLDGLIKNAGNALPTLPEILDTTKQIIAGYPEEFVINIVNELCILALQANTIKPSILPNIDRVNIQLLKPCTTDRYKLNESAELLDNENFDASKNVVILIPGWFENPNDSSIVDVMSKAYFCRDEENLLVYDAATFIDTTYFWSAFNTEKCGALLSNFLLDLSQKIPLENIHVIGHSLGAQVASAAGRYFSQKTNGKKIKHITGLDPAKPCFYEGGYLTGLSQSDADFVDVIHSDPGVFGEREPVGTVDFYTNGYAPLVPGCFDVICAHLRVVRYYAETVYPGNEKDFLASQCSSLDRLRHGQCNGKKQAMGYAVNTNLTGKYFLEVRGTLPYGMEGSKERVKANQNCGLCDEKVT